MATTAITRAATADDGGEGRERERQNVGGARELCKTNVTPLIRRNHGRSLYIATPNGDLHRQTIG